MPSNPIEVFYSYAHKDKNLRDELEKHLATLKRQGLIASWYDRNISAGTEWEREIDAHLNTASVILLLISPDFIASDYCYGIEVKRAIERHEVGEAQIIPIILRPVDWKNTPLRGLQALPTDAKPITTWGNRDKAFLDVEVGIRKAIEEHWPDKNSTERTALLLRRATEENTGTDNTVSYTSHAATQPYRTKQFEEEAQAILDNPQEIIGTLETDLPSSLLTGKTAAFDVSEGIRKVVEEPITKPSVNTSVIPTNIPSRPTSSKVKKLALLGLVLLVVVFGIIGFSSYQNHVISLNTTATAQAQQATTTASTNTPQAIYNRITSSSPVLDDPLSKNDIYKWQEYTDPGGFGCIITGGSYHIHLQSYAYLVCIAEYTNFSNFAYQVQMTIIRGESGGIVFRVVDFNTNKYYYFYISTDGTYALALSRDEHSSHDRLLRSGSSSFIKRGLKQSNLIAVVTSGSNIYLYVNKQYVTSVSDSTYSSGQIGVYAIDITTPTEVTFNHAQVWNV